MKQLWVTNKMKLFILILLMFFHALSYAEVFVKDGFPCVTELCIGDGLSELKNIQWDTVNLNDKSLSQSEIDEIKKRYMGEFSDQVFPYLLVRKFDKGALPLLSGITTLCSNNDAFLAGVYVTSAGNPTEVLIRLLPISNDSTEQRWTVVNIRRFVNKSMNEQDIVAAERQLSERYKNFNTVDEEGYEKTKPTDKGDFTFNKDARTFSFDLGYSSSDFNRFKRSTTPPLQCTKNVNFD
ncbi:MAG: hypothetical protein ABL884_00755 [Methyloglobulus sp.]|jgi:hypothetical protein